MFITSSKNEIFNHSKKVKSQGKKVSLVPTMGALHQGHLELIKTAQQHSDEVIASIFINPTQFSANEDFNTYPKSLERDLELLNKTGCNAVFTPTEQEIYPNGKPEAKNIVPAEIANILCGNSRPHFFHGVWIVVSRLFEATEPNIAIFGEKDYQQLFAIKYMTRLKKLGIEIIGAPIIRESDGLAMSSRNAYLNEAEREIAPLLHKELKKISSNLKENTNYKQLIKNSKDYLLENGFDNIDYLEIRDSNNLEELNEYRDSARIFAAAFLGKTRLIDNIGTN